jgi:sialate O-acetylesterase
MTFLFRVQLLHTAFLFLSLGTMIALSPSSGMAVALAAPVNQASIPLPTEVRLNALFSDNMVLQRDVSANLWGQAAPGESVSITLNDKMVTAKAGADGNWQVKLPAQKAGGPFVITITGKNTVTLRDVYFGDVWLLSGQSNMEWSSKSILKPEVFAVENPRANDPLMRLFIVKKNVQTAPTHDVSGTWKPCTPESMAEFSAAGYFFGRELRRKMGIPIGLVGSYWGGKPSEAFTSLGALQKDPAYADMKTTWDKTTAEYSERQKRYQEVVLPQWQADIEKAKRDGTTPPRRPGGPGGGPDDSSRPASLYNGMIAPLIPLSLKGIAWYQGESNGDNLKEAVEYKTLFSTLIRDWRAQWKQEIPFIFVQLANFRKVQQQPVESTQAWPYVREAQTLALSLPKTGMALALGNEEPDNIHPKDKITLGKRLADVALGTVYGQNVPFTGPLFDSVQIRGNTARVRFKHTDGGLKGGEGALKGFAIAGKDGKFVWADARIEGDSVVLLSAEVSQPIAVRYGWADNPIGNLQNGAGLPASPFRTDVNMPMSEK